MSDTHQPSLFGEDDSSLPTSYLAENQRKLVIRASAGTGTASSRVSPAAFLWNFACHLVGD